MGKSSGGSSPADVTGAARETGLQARRLNEAQTFANRPNQANAWGTTQWGVTPVWDQTTGQYINQWTQSETLNPTLQATLDSQMRTGQGRSQLAEAGMARVWDDMQTPVDFDQYGNPIGLEPNRFDRPQFMNFDAEGRAQDPFNFQQGMQSFDYDPAEGRQRAEDAAYQRSTARLDPQFQSEEASLRNRLRNQGLAPGDQAYDASVQNFNKRRNDAYEMARLGSVGEGRTESQQMFGQRLGAAQFGTQQQQQGFQQAAQQYGLNEAQTQQLFNQMATQTGISNQAQQQLFGQEMTQNQVANALRQQQMQEDLFARGYSLEEVNRLLEGQQIAGGPPTTGGETETIASMNLGG